MTCAERFIELYKKEPEAAVFCPYRVCPIGAHSDHQHGKITGFAIDKGIHIAFSPMANGVVEISSLQFEKKVLFHVENVSKTKVDDWADYLRGVTIMLDQSHPLSVGLCGVIEGTLPIGGLSSSAAVCIAFLKALCTVNKITLDEHEMINIVLKAENEYVGVSCGVLDQFCEVLSKKDNLLYLDTQDGSYELIPTKENIKPYEIMILFSGIERTLAGSKYNMRVDECRSAAYALKAFAGMPYGKFSETHLREVPYEVYLQYKDRLPENWAKRAEHWYSEFFRVQKGVEAWRNGDIEEYGRLSFESGRSSIYNYETGSPELKALYEYLLEADGVYGGRFSGAGFKGCCMALVDPAYEEQLKETITQKYSRAFPGLAGNFGVYFCRTADGVGR